MSPQPVDSSLDRDSGLPRKPRLGPGSEPGRRLGGVYQASGFLYLGCHTSQFYELEGEWFHKISVTGQRSGKNGQRGRYLVANLNRAREHYFRQFRY